MQKSYSQIDQSARMLLFVEFEKRRELAACVHNLRFIFLFLTINLSLTINAKKIVAEASVRPC
jgi:hypothetical protein